MPLAEQGSGFFDNPPPKKKKSGGGLTPVQEHIELVHKQGSASAPGSFSTVKSTVISRQRFLRALGFNVVVDGIWGPRSQAAWQAYLSRSGRSAAQATSSFDRDRHELMVFNRRLAATQAHQAARLQATLSKIQAAQVKLGGLFGPDSGGDTPRPHLGQLGIVENQIAREREQQQRAAFYGSDRGAAALTVLSLSEKLADPRTRRRALAGMSASNLRTLLFDPGFGALRRPGDLLGRTPGVAILQGYLQAHGYRHVKVTGKLDLDTYDGLTKEMERLAEEEYHASVREIRDLFFGASGQISDVRLRVDGPINLADLPGFHGRVPTAQQIVDRLSANDPVARRLLRELYHRLSVKQMAELRYKRGHAATLQAAEARASQEFIAAAAREAEHSGILGTIGRPFDYLSDVVRTSLVAGYHDFKDLATGDFSLHDRSAVEREAIAEIGLFDSRHPWLGIASSMLADPTILIPGRVFLAPAVLGVKGITRLSLDLERLGYALSETGHIVRLPALTLTVPARGGRLAIATTGEVADFLVTHPVTGRVWLETRHATRLLGDTRQAAHAATVGALRRGFAVAARRPLDVMSAGVKAPPDVAATYDQAFDGFVKFVDAPSDDILNEAVNLRLSVFNHQALEGEDISDFGRMLRGTYAASARMKAVLDLAQERAEAAADALRSRSEHGLVRAEYERVFEETINQAGPYAVGSSELDDVIDARVQLALRAFDRGYLPALQRRIEMAFDDLGESLWDEEGHWIGANGDVTETLRKLGAREFADDVAEEVPNPLFNRYFSHNEALDFQARELRIRTAQKESWAAARRSAGDPLPEEWVEREVAGIKDELNAAWKRVESGPQRGLWTDTRETLRVAPHYARQYQAIRDLRPEPFEVRGGKDPEQRFRVSDLPRSPRKRALGGEVDFGFAPLQMSVDRVASYFRFLRPEGEDVPAITRGYEYLLDGERAAGDLLPDEAEVLRMRDFQGAYGEFETAWNDAYDAIYAQQLARQGALYSAMRYSQHRGIRMTWYAAEGWLGLWRFMVLPLRFGWTTVNYIDNAVKAMLQGVVSPKHWFGALQGGGQRLLDVTDAAHTVFEAGWSEIRQATRFFDEMFGTNMTATIDSVFDYFWQLPYELHARVFSLHGLEFPEEFLEAAVYGREGGRVLKGADDLERMIARGETPTALDRAQVRLKSFHDRVWDLMGNRAENFARRALYYRTYEKAVKDGHGLLDAHTLAWAKVDETLFDYSKISTFEDNVRFIVPFIQWARKNNQFWLRTAARRPGLSLGVIDSYQEARAQINEDLPDWMQRYMPLKWASDVVARVPGLHWMVGPLADSVTDPIKLLSVSNLYSYFAGENPNLPADRAGNEFMDGFVGALEDFGFRLNPLVRKPLELSSVLSLRTWQSVFPQTSLLEAFTRKFWSDRFPNGLNIEIMLEDAVLQLMGQEPTADDAADNMDTYVRMEMAAQAQRGEQVSRERAERKIADWLLVQQVVGYAMGVYLRRMTPEDIYYAQIADQMRLGALDFSDLSDEERINYRLFKFANLTDAERVDLAKRLGVPVGSLPDNAMYDRYVEMLPLVRAFYAIPTYVQARSFLNDHKELMPFVEETLTNYGGETGLAARDRLGEQTELAFSLFDLVDKLDLAPETVKAANSLLVTPELQAYWDGNDTPAERREKMLRGQFHRHISRLNSAYHAIPEDDFDARKGFLRENPALLRSWWDDNSGSDDFKVIVNGVNADLRERYFEYADAGDWDGAGEFLSQFPFMFDHVDSKARLHKDFTTGRTQFQHARDYAKVKGWLEVYYALPPSQQDAWLHSDAEGASQVQRYLALYGSTRPGAQGGLTQHARDYLAAKEWLDYYFALSSSARSAWLNGGSRGAEVVLAYFKRYGHVNRIGRSFSSVNPALLGTRNAELARRLEFWRRYFALPAWERPLFVSRHAADYGIFVYGILGAKERHDAEMAWLRRAFLAGLSDRAAHFLYIKPLLDFYFTIKDKDARRLFLRANPEVQAYFDEFSRKSISGDPKLDKLVEAYFRLPEDSNERAFFLHKHPEVQHYFDLHSTPAELAMRNLLDVYFGIENKQQREKFLAQHPEISVYFEKRRAERDAEQFQLDAFDQADPRLRPYIDAGQRIIPAGAEWMRRILAGTTLEGGLSVRTSRTPA